MKLLQLNSTANWGSTGKIAEGIGDTAIKRGWDSYIAYGRYINPSRSNLIKVGNTFDVYAHYAKARFLDGEGLGSKRATKELIGKIKDLSPDIIHLHNIHDHWLNYPALFEYLATIDTPIVWTFHDCWAFTGGCAYFDTVDCNKWSILCNNCIMRVNKIDKSARNYELKRSLIEMFGNRLYIVPVSKWLGGFVNKSFLHTYNCQVIHNGIDINRFNSSENHKKENYILGVALPWSKRKGLDDIIRLRKILSQSINIKLAGLSKPQINSLPPGIIGIERTQNVQELAELYSGAIALINPTHEDNFPTVNLEALSCGTPVITYRTGGSPEAVNERTGLVVEKGDISALAKGILEIIDSPQKFKSEDCRQRAELCFNKDVQFGKYIDLYESILN